MKCLDDFGNTFMQEDTSALLTCKGEVHGRARGITLVTAKIVLLYLKGMEKMFEEKC